MSYGIIDRFGEAFIWVIAPVILLFLLTSGYESVSIGTCLKLSCFLRLFYLNGDFCKEDKSELMFRGFFELKEGDNNSVFTSLG